jgi:dihydrodipicolinate synthase/N-acetylneuraminate lyase
MLFSESSPIPVKMSLYLQGIFRSPELRLPLVEMSTAGTDKLQKLMQSKGLLK